MYSQLGLSAQANTVVTDVLKLHTQVEFHVRHGHHVIYHLQNVTSVMLVSWAWALDWTIQIDQLHVAFHELRGHMFVTCTWNVALRFNWLLS